MKKVVITVCKSIRRSWIYIKQRVYNGIFHARMWIFGIEHGTGVRTAGAVPCVHVNGGKLRLGNNILFSNYLNTAWYTKCKLTVEKNAFLTIGNNTGMNGTLIHCTESITIGNNVMIGGASRIYDTNFHNTDYLKRRDPLTNTIAQTKPVVIEDDVFIGTNCIIGKGVTIGARSIIAAGSVVVKSIPADVIAGGNPCKVIKQINNTQA
ncbi:MAG: acyltransferase [Prevotella sp.]|nr:acyltransferase [Prevotella sp.]